MAVIPRPGYPVLIGAVAVERIAELVVSQRNLAWSRARDGVEYGAGHYPFMVALHTGLLAGCLAEAAGRRRSAPGRITGSARTVVVLAQLLRWWCIATLGRQWNTRVVVVPGAPHVERGPYRLIRHPNYVAVVAEGVALPLAGGAWITAAVFSILNAALLRRRITVENTALESLT